jgi:hypothetical protein
MRISVVIALFLAVLPIRMPAQPTDWCTPSTAVKAALDQLPTQSPTETRWEFQQKRGAAIQELLTRFSGDLFVQKIYIRSMYRRADKDKVIAEYKARYENSPNDPVVAYLYNMAIEGRQSAEAIKILETALSKSPQFPWPHLGLASFYGTPVFLNKDEKVKQVKAFLAACPESLDGYQKVTDLDEKDVLTQYAAKLRAMLQTRTDIDAIEAYGTLWSIEFKAHPLSEYSGLRKQVGEDLKRIQALNREDKREWYETLEEGYKLARDQMQADWASDARQHRLPQPWELASMSKWNKDHPRPQIDDAADTKRTYYTELLKQTDAWLKERPKMIGVWASRLEAMEHLEDTPTADVEAVAGEYVNLLTSAAGPDGPDSYECFTIARVLSKKHLQPERVLELAGKGLAQVKVESSEPYWDTYATKENLQESHFYRSLDPATGSGLEAESYIQLKQADRAHLALVRMEDELQAANALVGDKAEFKKEYTSRLAAWWGLMARTAELQNHEQDAMAFYEHALLARFEAQQMPETGMRDEIAENARRLFTKLGGTNDGWQIWYGSRADKLASQATLTWEDANQPLPSFELADLKGKTWTQASLKGKVTFLNFWASW